jgi:hypothetical protein
MSRIENLGEGLVILPSLTDAVAGGGSSGQLFTQAVVLDEHDVAEAEWLQAYRDSLDSGSSSANESASSLPALRSDSGEVVWRLTEKAMAHFEGSRDRRGQEVARIQLAQCRGSAECNEAGSVEASCV